MRQACVLSLRQRNRPPGNASWTSDFVHDITADGRRFRALVVDEYTRECR